ncbi:MAG: DUF4150 domain-containing protein [Byssovorax sp.]
MTITVNINNLSLVHKRSTGYSVATLPDVCKTPSPGGPVPVPYPNIARATDLTKGTTTVNADGGNMCANYGSEFSRSTGDEPGTVGGVKSGVFTKEATWITFSMDVKLEGKGACRLSDKMFHNRGNTVNAGGTINPPLTAGSLKTKLLKCKEARAVYNRAKKANGGKHPIIAMEPSVIKSGGDTDLSAGKIRIDKVDGAGKAYDPCAQVETLCFELGNLSRKASFTEANKLVKTASRTRYIRGQERIEYNNAKATIKATEACKDRWGCPKMKSGFEWVKGPKDFDDYFKNFLSNTHKEVYGKYWDSIHHP